MADTTGMDAVALAALLRDSQCHHGGHGGHGDYRGYGREDWRTEQNQANMSLMQSIGQVDKAVAVSTADMQASQATQSAGIVAQLNSLTASLATRVDGLKDVINSNSMHLAEKMCVVDKSIMENRYELSKDITHDGDKTRSLITAQYEATLNRLLAEARNEIVELRHDNRSNLRSHDNSLNVTQTVNQAQQQAQQQSQFDRLYHMLHDAAQNIRATNQAINIGSGRQTANPENTSTNNRVN
jgi:hypothetical protein